MAKVADLVWVDPALIEEPLHILRPVDKTGQGYKDLLASMKADGFWPHRPLDVSQDGAAYVLCDGLNRLTVARELELELVPIVVSKKMSEAERLTRSVVNNATNIETKPVEYAKACATLIKLNPGWTLADVARRVKKSTEWVNKRLGLAKLEGKAAELVDKQTITIEAGVMLQKLQARGIAITDELLVRAAKEPVADFVADSKALLDRKKPDRLFKLRPITDVKDELTRAEKDKKSKPGYVDALKWVLRQDPASQAEREKR